MVSLTDHYILTLSVLYGLLVKATTSLAGQPLHKEEGSGVMPILDLFWRLCKMHCEYHLHLSRLWLRAPCKYIRASRSSLSVLRLSLLHLNGQDGMLIEF